MHVYNPLTISRLFFCFSQPPSQFRFHRYILVLSNTPHATKPLPHQATTPLSLPPASHKHNQGILTIGPHQQRNIPSHGTRHVIKWHPRKSRVLRRVPEP